MPSAIQVSWAQLQTPNHAVGVPIHPHHPFFGHGGGCGCGCACARCGGPPANPQAPNVAANPVGYATGEVVLSAADLHGDGFGVPWGHTRSFASQLTQITNAGNGNNWQVREWAYLVVQDSGTVVVMGAANDVLWFDPAGSTFTARFGVRETLALDPVNNVYNLYDLDGSVWQFSAATGGFLNHSDPAGNRVAVAGTTSNGFNFTEVQRTVTAASVTTVESYLYQYVDATAAYPLLSSVTLRRSANGGAWSFVSTVLYTYYGANDPSGSVGDLQTVVTQTWDNGSWATTGTTLYRYWLGTASPSSSSSGPSSSSQSSGSSGGGGGGASLLKYVVLPSSYARLAAVANPLTASDATVAQYADNYFAYDGNARVITESVDGGTRTFGNAYTQSANANGYNSWATKTVETRPDGSQNILYANYAGQTMLRVLQSGSSQWCDFYQYDNATGDLLLHAPPSAVTGYSEAYADLLHAVSGVYQYLHNTTGKLALYQYHGPTGYLTAELVQQGQLGAPIFVRQYQYVACGTPSSSSSSPSSSSSGPTPAAPPVYFLAAEILYPSDGQSSSSSSSSSGPLPQIVTTYAYTWYPGTCQVQQRITTLPVISIAQNGSGIANTRADYYDLYGNLTWQRDERGFLTRSTYDIPTGAITQRIDDVNTTLVTDAPPGWTTPAGGGLDLITDFTIDGEGRTTQTLGPTHTIDVGGVATVIRRAHWTVYQDATQQVWTGMGYATGTAPSYAYTLINPVSIAAMDTSGRPVQQIQATRASTSGALQSTDSFPQSSYTRWSVEQYGNDNLLAAQLAYKLIPATGAGTVGTNYDQTLMGYDAMNRPNRQVSGGGTITRTVFDVRGNAASMWIGTNDTGATDSDPTGGGAASNNMVIVSANQYDGGAAGGDNNLTQTTQYVDSTTTRVTHFLYDWRDRRTDSQGRLDFYQKSYFDNLDRPVKSERYNTTLAGNLIARTLTNFDDLSRVYQTIRYGVDPITGIVGNALVDNNWYDPAGNVLVQFPAGAQLFTKSAYDSLNRPATHYQAFYLGTMTYAEAGSAAADTVLEQVETAFDAASNAIQTTSRHRYHNATGVGPLGSPSSAQPLARVAYVAQYPDALGRTVAVADYGTNGGTALVRTATVPARADTTLVNSTQFDSAGNVLTTTDPAATVTCLSYDNLGRAVQRTMNCAAGSSSSAPSSSSGTPAGCPASLDTNVTIQTAYNADGNVSAITALNSKTGNQATQYAFGTTLADSSIASSLLKRYEILPDSVGGSDQLAFTYNRQGEVVTKTDQMGTVHEIDYDLLGRPNQDRVTTLGAGVDGAVLRIATTYEVRGMVQTITSYDNATVGLGNIVNQVQEVYNNFGQLTAEYQSHGGAVVIGTTPVVQYGYANGSANTIRPTTMTYPNGRVLNTSYGASGSNEDATSRVAALIDNDGVTHLVDYTYLGFGRFVQTFSAQPGLTSTLIGIAGGNDPDTGDIYRGLDRFSRIKDLIWLGGGSSSSGPSSSSGTNILDRIQHGYDRVGNRQYRSMLADPNDQHDEWYDYDGLHRLKDMQRGSLNATKTGINTLQFAQCWGLDETGNWGNFREDDNGDGIWDLIQNRASNPANEITVVTETAGPTWFNPAYDKAGNMTTMPQPAAPTQSYTATYDAWNRLVQLMANGITVASYAYDGSARRVVKDTYISGMLTTARHFFYSTAWQILEERLGNAVTADRQFAWGIRNLDDLLCRDRETGQSQVLNERLFALQDPNWNVTASVDSGGHVQERYDYQGFGLPLILTPTFLLRSASLFDIENLFAGYRIDNESSLYQIRYRYYHPIIGAFASREPFGYGADFINLLMYVANNPINFRDPMGLQPDAEPPAPGTVIQNPTTGPGWATIQDLFGPLPLSPNEIGDAISLLVAPDDFAMAIARLFGPCCGWTWINYIGHQNLNITLQPGSPWLCPSVPLGIFGYSVLLGAVVGAVIGGLIGTIPGAIVGGAAGALLGGVGAAYGLTALESQLDTLIGGLFPRVYSQINCRAPRVCRNWECASISSNIDAGPPGGGAVIPLPPVRLFRACDYDVSITLRFRRNSCRGTCA